MLKRMLALGGLAVLAALAFAIPAQASGVKAACVIEGGAKTNPPVKVSGGSGSYTFTTLTIVCVGLEKGLPAAPAVVNATSTGTYTNTVCGTGKATSPVGGTSGTSADPKVAGILPTLSYTVDFVGTVGLFYWLAPTMKGLPSLPKPGDGLSHQFGGVVQIGAPLPTEKVPVVPPPNTTDCTKAFHVTGSIVIDTGLA